MLRIFAQKKKAERVNTLCLGQFRAVGVVGGVRSKVIGQIQLFHYGFPDAVTERAPRTRWCTGTIRGCRQQFNCIEGRKINPATVGGVVTLFFLSVVDPLRNVCDGNKEADCYE